jgi:hypothetical protein
MLRLPMATPTSLDSDALTRTALALQAFGVTEFATANVKDFEGLGFAKVWNPIAIK